jgi:hypothetical protein
LYWATGSYCGRRTARVFAGRTSVAAAAELRSPEPLRSGEVCLARAARGEVSATTAWPWSSCGGRSRRTRCSGRGAGSKPLASWQIAARARRRFRPAGGRSVRPGRGGGCCGGVPEDGAKAGPGRAGPALVTAHASLLSQALSCLPSLPRKPGAANRRESARHRAMDSSHWTSAQRLREASCGRPCQRVWAVPGAPPRATRRGTSGCRLARQPQPVDIRCRRRRQPQGRSPLTGDQRSTRSLGRHRRGSSGPRKRASAVGPARRHVRRFSAALNSRGGLKSPCWGDHDFGSTRP